ncbi:MAG: hypothetical protein ACKVQW_06620 [Pyrinomonadaceae bacterium]
MRYFRPLVFVAVLLVVPSTTMAIHWDLFYRFCPEEFIEIPGFLEEIPIPVGCEVVDCCPGCPGPPYIDWRINIDKTRFQGATLRFEGLTQKHLAQLQIKGDAKITDKGEIALGSGEVRISGLPVEMDGKVPVGFVTPKAVEKLDAAAQESDADKSAADSRNDADGSGGIDISQYVGDFRVNRFRSRYYVIPCRRGLEDKLRLTNNTTGDTAIAMLDDRTGACNNDLFTRTAATASMGNILSNGSCRSTVSVFSDDNAMSYEPNVTTWTDPIGDTHTVNLQPIITVPVSVWVANNAQLVVAQNDFANANLLYNQNNSGIQFNPTFNDVSGNAAAVAAIGTGCPGAAGPLQGSGFYTASRLNIYYVNSAFTGVNCGVDRNMNFIGTTANLGSLPHEIGHAYGLRPSASNGHVNGVAGFGNNNIMWGGGPGTRNQFTIAQSFRLNTDTTSMLNANGNRVGPTETCLPNVSSAICPALILDSVPH